MKQFCGCGQIKHIGGCWWKKRKTVGRVPWNPKGSGMTTEERRAYKTQKMREYRANAKTAVH